MKHSEYVEIIKSTAVQIESKLILGVLLTEAPFLFWGPLAPLTKALVNKICQASVNAPERAAFFEYTDMRVDKQGLEFTDLAISNYHIQQTGTEDEKKKSEESLIIAFKSFAKLTN